MPLLAGHREMQPAGEALFSSLVIALLCCIAYEEGDEPPLKGWDGLKKVGLELVGLKKSFGLGPKLDSILRHTNILARSESLIFFIFIARHCHQVDEELIDSAPLCPFSVL